MLLDVALVALAYTLIVVSPSALAVTLPPVKPTVAIVLSLVVNLTTSVDVAGVKVALSVAVSPTAAKYNSESTVTDFALCKTLKVLLATALPVFLFLAVIFTEPGATGFILPVVKPIVATFLLLV